MRIVIDMQGAQTESRFRGIGRYTTALVKAIARNAREHEIWIVLNNNFQETIEGIRISLADIVPMERILIFAVAQQISWETPSNAWRRRASELIREKFLFDLTPDIVLVTSLFEGANKCDAALSLGTFDSNPDYKVAVVLYDLIPLLDPDNYLRSDWVHSWYMDKIENLKRADLLLSISEYSRQEAIEALCFDGSSIKNISSAHANIFQPYVEGSEFKQDRLNRYGILKPYAMYNGAVEPRKNLGLLLEAFALLPPKILSSHQLVLVGKVSDLDRNNLMALAKKLRIEEQLILTGYVDDDDLVELFKNCQVFVFPSLHEGFGLPALEALACGAATLGSTVTSIPEVIGLTDALFDPRDPKDISDKIFKALTDDNFRNSLRMHAIRQAKKFSWDLCAKRAISGFAQLICNSPVKRTNLWSDYLARSSRSYEQLIGAIAKIPPTVGLPTDEDLKEIAGCIVANSELTNKIARFREQLPEQIKWRIEGPFDSSYSLALLNRETARSLEGLGHQVILHSTEGPGDFLPNEEFLCNHPDLEVLYARSKKVSIAEADATSRNLYPPRVSDMNCRFNLLHHYAWEESGFPDEWANNFNEYLQGVSCLSQHVRKILVDSGVKIPMSVTGCGVDHWLRVRQDTKYKLECKKFRFLHVSSCFPRKGVDVLLRAYGKAFTKHDDVTLVIKTFKNPHNEIYRWIDEIKIDFPDFPDIKIIEDDLTDGELKSLYEQCQVMVSPSRAEGFGLPMAEAILSGLAVITTGWGGQLDFCNPKTSWLVDYKFVPAESHFDLFDSVWAEPNADHLAAIMKSLYDAPFNHLVQRVAAGQKLLLENFRWVDVGSRLINSLRAWASAPKENFVNIGWVTSWNTRCGIATYSAHLLENIPCAVSVFAARTKDLIYQDGSEVVRCWDSGMSDTLTDLSNAVEDRQIDALVIQFNYAFFNIERFGTFLTDQLNAGRVIILTLHSTVDPVHVLQHQRLEIIRESLARCHRILVHTVQDLNRLKALELVENVTLFPHGIRYLPQTYPLYNDAVECTENTGFVIASYGFFLPHKGLLELIEALALLKSWGHNISLRMINSEYPASESTELIQQATKRVSSLGLSDRVIFMTDFLSDDESLAQLSLADLIVFPYQDTGESASGAVRYGISTGKPVAVTPLPIFEDVLSAVYVLPGRTPELIAKGIEELIFEISKGSEVAREKAINAQRWRESHGYASLGQRLLNMISAIHAEKSL